MKFIADSYHGDFIAKTQQQLGNRLKAISKELQQRIRARFMISRRDHLPYANNYPFKLTGQLARSIKVTPVRHAGGFVDSVRIEAGHKNERKRSTLFSLEKGQTALVPKRAQFLTIPVTMEAMRHTSKGGTARSFPEPLTYSVVNFQGRRVRALVKKSSSFARGRGVNSRPVYILTKGPIRIPPRAGLADAFLEEQDWLRRQIERPL